jgi:predicted RNA-binding Zn ribbon-like protein
MVLREAMYRVFHSVVRSTQPSKGDLDILNRELLKARAHERLIRTTEGFTFEWKGQVHELDRILWPIVHSAAEFLTDADLSRLRECGGEDCGWLFEDTSRNRSRQWCYMQGCGNLSKVRRFRRRRKEG